MCMQYSIWLFKGDMKTNLKLEKIDRAVKYWKKKFLFFKKLNEQQNSKTVIVHTYENFGKFLV